MSRAKKATRLLLAILTLMALGYTMMAQKEADSVAFEPVNELMQMIASAEDADKETVAAALESFMGELTSFLEEQGVPGITLDKIQGNFMGAMNEFLTDRTGSDEFGQEVAILARRLQTEGELMGVNGYPEKLLEKIGVPTEVIPALVKGQPENLNPTNVTKSIANKKVGPEGRDSEESQNKGKSKEESKSKSEEQGKKDQNNKGKDNSQGKGNKGKSKEDGEKNQKNNGNKGKGKKGK